MQKLKGRVDRFSPKVYTQIEAEEGPRAWNHPAHDVFSWAVEFHRSLTHLLLSLDHSPFPSFHLSFLPYKLWSLITLYLRCFPAVWRVSARVYVCPSPNTTRPEGKLCPFSSIRPSFHSYFVEYLLNIRHHPRYGDVQDGVFALMKLKLQQAF